MLLGKLELLSCFLCMWIHKHISKIEKRITFYSVAEQNTYLYIFKMDLVLDSK